MNNKKCKHCNDKAVLNEGHMHLCNNCYIDYMYDKEQAYYDELEYLEMMKNPFAY